NGNNGRDGGTGGQGDRETGGQGDKETFFCLHSFAPIPLFTFGSEGSQGPQKVLSLGPGCKQGNGGKGMKAKQCLLHSLSPSPSAPPPLRPSVSPSLYHSFSTKLTRTLSTRRRSISMTSTLRSFQTK